MDKLSSPNSLCKRKRLACSPVQAKPEEFSPCSMLWRQASWLIPDTLLLILRCSETSFPIVTTRFFRLLKTVLTVKVFFSEKNEDSIPVILQVIQQTVAILKTVLNHYGTQQGFPETSQTFSSYLFDHLGQTGNWNFLLRCQSCHFLAQFVFEGVFDGHLAYN